MAHEVVFAKYPPEYQTKYVEWVRALGYEPNDCLALNAYINDEGTEVTVLHRAKGANGRPLMKDINRCPSCGQGLVENGSKELTHTVTVSYAVTKPLIANPKDFDLVVGILRDGTPPPVGTIALTRD